MTILDKLFFAKAVHPANTSTLWPNSCAFQMSNEFHLTINKKGLCLGYIVQQCTVWLHVKISRHTVESEGEGRMENYSPTTKVWAHFSLNTAHECRQSGFHHFFIWSSMSLFPTPRQSNTTGVRIFLNARKCFWSVINLRQNK